MTKITINGPPPAAGPRQPPPPRREIHDLINDHESFSLYIQAITALQALDQKELLSWFQIAGIHGLPPTPWQEDKSKPTWGYCAHGIPLFPTWHRAYMSLYEQALQAEAAKIAKSYSDSTTWGKLAASLRAPYWDWAKYIIPPEELYIKKVLSIITSTGVDKNYPNPLLFYKFHPALPYPGQPDLKETWRAPGMIDRLKTAELTLKKDVFKTLTLLDNWINFSKFAPAPSGRPIANSLEVNHNGMHVRIGGGGSMSDTSVAGFDPIFWLHHANVDRQLALWQGLHPTKWISEDQGLKTALRPFWNSQTTQHTSLSDPVRVWTDFVFNYPEFLDLYGQPPEKIQQTILTRVYELYGPDKARGGMVPEPFKDWHARVHSKAYSLGGSYSIYLFFGEVPASPAEWITADNVAGIAEVFANPHPEACENCTHNIDVIHEAIVDLTIALQRVDEYDKSDESVKEYIQNNLKYGVRKVDGTVVPNDQVPGLSVVVESTILSFDKSRGPGGSNLPTATPPVEHIRF